ncbi:hypothetical protein EKH55_1430 [Sinorhizobium alkalisoli]|nr:hypothetical protein EKH55_1430 [Sinorhizobium alkalisoli]
MLAGQHGASLQNRETNQEQTLSVPFVFRKCLTFREYCHAELGGVALPGPTSHWAVGRWSVDVAPDQ